jgi:hypothetical protein
VDGTNVRHVLRVSQTEEPWLNAIIEQKRSELDLNWRKKHAQPSTKVQRNPLSLIEAQTYRLSPEDDVLEKQVLLHCAVIWVPCIPDTQMPSEMDKISWRQWLFRHAHTAFLQSHRKGGETFQALRRMGYWATLNRDFDVWYAACEVCHAYRTMPVQGPLRSILGSDKFLGTLPWTDVIVDVQGPYTRAEGGEMYVLSYHCTVLKVPKLQAFPSLQRGYFSRALVECVFKSRVIPDIVRTDRGPEMTNAVTE